MGWIYFSAGFLTGSLITATTLFVVTFKPGGVRRGR